MANFEVTLDWLASYLVRCGNKRARIPELAKVVAEKRGHDFSVLQVGRDIEKEIRAVLGQGDGFSVVKDGGDWVKLVGSAPQICPEDPPLLDQPRMVYAEHS